MSEGQGTTAATQAFIGKQFKENGVDGPLEGEEEMLAVHQFITTPGQVRCELGLTINLGNFESAKLSVGLVVPCYKEESDAAFNFAKKWVAERVAKEVQEIREKKNVDLF